jgi:glucose/arabinose dehydrogenase
MRDGKAGTYEVFADGFPGVANVQPGSAQHRPTGVAVGPDGSLYITDDAGGRIYRIFYRGN